MPAHAIITTTTTTMAAPADMITIMITAVPVATTMRNIPDGRWLSGLR